MALNSEHCWLKKADEDGTGSRATKRLAGMGANGRHKGNCLRDFHRQQEARVGHKLMKPYVCNVPYLAKATFDVVWTAHWFFLPHEFFSYMYRFPDEFKSRILDPDKCANFWRNACNMPWFDLHAARHDSLNHPGEVVQW